MKVVIIAAIAEDGTIGQAGKIPWHIREDLKRFKRLTMGHPIIMGRRTRESIGKPLPGRRNIVLTRHAAGPDQFPDLPSALKSCGDDDVFIIGGGEVYRAALPAADRLLLTHVRHPGGGDTKFPEYDRSEWREVHREESAECTYVEYERLRHLSRHV
jgi:dihydrofolate reductase